MSLSETPPKASPCDLADPLSCSSPVSSELHCGYCKLPFDEKFVRALDGTFHWECFVCLDCHEPVASKFFPIDAIDGSQQPLCERDYFRRLKLVCDNCGDALRGSYITAVGKKFHMDHFSCSVCSVLFGPDDSYYEHENNVYCHEHYSNQFAIKCSGCQSAILKQFVEINRNSIDEHWHPECYMVHKFWNVKLAQPADAQNIGDQQISGRNVQNGMEEKVYRIWTVLSAFEESAAACISDMLLHVSVGSYLDGVKKADNFITHVEVLFGAIDDLLDQYHYQAEEELHHEREAKMLCKKIASFFALLSHTQETGTRRPGFTQELLTLVTGLAHYLKLLIRIGLTGALRLERMQEPDPMSIGRFLCHLMELANKQRGSPMTPERPTPSDLCQSCGTICEDQCFKSDNNLWHDGCFECSKCKVLLRDEYADAFLHTSRLTLMCKQCIVNTDGYKQGFELVTPLQQYSFLLRTSLRHLYGILSVYDNPVTQQVNGGAQTVQTKETPPGINSTGARTTSLVNTENPLEKINLGDIKRLKSNRAKSRLTDSHRVAKRSTLLETPSPNAAYVNNQPHEASSRKNEQWNETSNTAAHMEDVTYVQLQRLGKEDALTLEDIPELVAAQQHHMDIAQNPTPRQRARQQANTAETRSRYFTELSALEHFMVKHISVLHLEEMLREHFTMEELVDLIDDNKNSTLWGKFFTSFKTGGVKKAPRTKEGTFGVPLDILIEKNGVESNFGMGSTSVRIPTFIDDSISAMRQMDMSIEGIFRKNGNIRRLKDTAEEIDRNPNGIQLINETPVQVAALTKKFLRELPDPLLTFKLYRLFIIAQSKITKPQEDRRRALHLICCLLPKVNRDTMEVLFLFMKWVATFSHVDEEAGSKMDLMNLATVLAPNILYPKSKDPAKEESFPAIEAVHMLLQYQEEFCTVPEDFVPMLQKLSYTECDRELNAKDILKKCQTVMVPRRQQSAGGGMPPLPRQHSSPAAVMSHGSTKPAPPSPSPPLTQSSLYYLSSSPVDMNHPNSSPLNSTLNYHHPIQPHSFPMQRMASQPNNSQNQLLVNHASH
ncbi:hypothetical protein CLU79DRAFT_804434 [Phycomyces nitens]|nr:hypothetical protein CLU79DRAFT_804434 [Phycomyces nitens]